MGDYEDEELPSISVNTANDSDSFVMPDAHILASQRAEEAARDDEIKRLRAEDSEKEPEVTVGLLRRADSSGSEGEVTLAATLNALQVAPPPAAHPSIYPADVLLELASVTPSPASEYLYELSECLRAAELNQIKTILDDVLDTIEDMTVTTPGRWEEADLVAACGACAAATQRANDPSGRARVRRARRLLQHLFDNVASHFQIDTISAEWAQLPEPILVVLGGVVTGATGRGGARVAHALNARATRTILKEPKQFLSFYGGLDAQGLLPLVKESWRSLSAKDQHRVLPLIGRALRDGRESAGEEKAREKLLNILAKPMPKTTAGTDRNNPNRLKVMVGVSKLQLLFHNKPC